jgi:hypothetical protein
MRLFPIAAFLSLTISPQPSCGESPDVDDAIKRGLEFLARDAVAWKNEHGCVSCHHAGLVVWAMHEARQRSYAVDEPLLAELSKWIAESGDGKTSLPRPAGIPKALNVKAVHFALALGADPTPDELVRQGLARLSKTVKDDQTANGSWASWPETRPPIFGNSDDSMTALATLALLPAATQGDEEAIAVRDKGLRWLSETPTDDDPQSAAMRLVLWRRLERPVAESKLFADRIEARQNSDGGWSQAAEMASDAWATGQALYALGHAGVEPDSAVVARGRAFLLKAQREDGSWPMTSRPSKPGDQGAANLVPITGAGSAWAILGLVRSGKRP